MKLDVKAAGVAFGLLWGFGLFFLTWWMILAGGAQGAPTLISRVYLGYSVTPLGSVIGLLWALADGFAGGVIFAWLYNRFLPAKPVQNTSAVQF
ncbi:MAG: bacteriophage holin [Endomicrobiales bacterium]|nr:bacteriophage holin [Endomicrobiales bacterium]